ncbi:serine/threonine-protein kinase fhke-related [Anaeramoeba flamelloides]|uniref:Serine/threonine-protein kinase fhke-related n=1 Tax=Anaeramoeba flamelloides TaxID=1746091 RepID=A0AAV7YSJ3_9EUKA|nr:serine/threonine-protein kinase fhke-related [Anaeramoeba flamelloides]
MDDFETVLVGEVDEEEPQDPNLYGKLISETENISHIPLYKDKIVTIGRHPSSTLVVLDNRISGRHCTIEYKEKDESNYSIIIRDFSTNGTFVNGQLIGKNKQTALFHTDLVSFVAPKNSSNHKLKPVASFNFNNFNIVPPCHNLNSCISEYYDLKKQIGKGQFATVHLAIEKSTGDRCAIKIIDKKQFLESNSEEKNKIMDEVNILHKINHKNVVGLKKVFDKEDYLYMVMELAKGGQLSKKILENGKYSEEKSRIICKQLLAVIEYLQSKRIVHRDLKPDNILLSSENSDTFIKVSDFGVSAILEANQKMYKVAGTPNFIAPEIIKSIQSGEYGMECDLWSLGVVMYNILSGYLPFPEDGAETNLYFKIKKGDFDFPNDPWQDVSIAAKNFIKRLLTVDVKKRITIKESLNHPWILDQNERITDINQTNYNQIDILNLDKESVNKIGTKIANEKFKENGNNRKGQEKETEKEKFENKNQIYKENINQNQTEKKVEKNESSNGKTEKKRDNNNNKEHNEDEIEKDKEKENNSKDQGNGKERFKEKNQNQEIENQFKLNKTNDIEKKNKKVNRIKIKRDIVEDKNKENIAINNKNSNKIKKKTSNIQNLIKNNNRKKNIIKITGCITKNNENLNNNIINRKRKLQQTPKKVLNTSSKKDPHKESQIMKKTRTSITNSLRDYNRTKVKK